MSSSEDYLDNLLASAIQKNQNPDSGGSDMSSLDLGTEDNPNRMMSEDEIAALIQNMNSESEANPTAPARDLSRFGKREEIDESVSDALSNRKEEGNFYSPVNVDESVSEALSNKKEDPVVYSSVNVEESVSEALAKPRETGRSNDAYTSEEIENKADELLSVLQDDMNDDTDDEPDDIESRIKAAEQAGMNDAAKAGLLGLSLSEESMDFTDFVDSKGIHNSEISGVSELLKKSDEGKLIDEASLPPQAFTEPLNLSGNPHSGIAGTEQEENPDAFEENKKKKKRRKDKKADKKRKNDSGSEIQDEEIESTGKKKNKQLKEKDQSKKKKGLFWFLQKNREESEQKQSETPSVSGVLEEYAGPENPANAPVFHGDSNEVSQMNMGSPESELGENTVSSIYGGDNPDNSIDDSEIIFPLENMQPGEELPETDNNIEIDSNVNIDKKEKKKKENIFTKLFNLLTEEVDEEETYVPEQDMTKLSQENLDILSSLDAAEENNKGKKKEKKKKEKKVKEKKAKPKKKKKKKPEKAAQEDTKQIPRKHIMKTAAMAISMLAILLLLCLFLPEKMVVGEAREAYYQEDYKNVFLSLYGKELNESDQLIYDRSKLIVLLERKYESYVNYKALGMKLEALNSLMEGLKRYDDIAERGEKLNVKEKLDEIRSNITAALLSDYALTESEALEILQYSELDYSNCLNSIVDGTVFIKAEDAIRSSYGLSDQSDSNGEVSDSTQLPDLLPEELEYQQSLIQDGVQAEDSVLQNEAVENQNESSGSSPSVGGAVNQNGQSLQLQIDSEHF